MLPKASVLQLILACRRGYQPEDWTAPSRMDWAHVSLPERVPSATAMDRELLRNWRPTSERFIAIWQIGVPNVLFTGGEPTIRADLVELILEAEQFVTGLVTNGRKLL